MSQRYECTEDILGRAMVLSEILNTHLSDLEEHLRNAGVSDDKVDFLEALSWKVSKDYDHYLFMVDDIIHTQ